MNHILKTKSTSANTAIGEDIILRETQKSRLVFRPMLIKNPHDPKHCVKGDFVYQVKKTSGNWEDYKTLNLNDLRDKEWVRIQLHSEELYTLIASLDTYYGVFKKYGIRQGETEFFITDRTVRPLLEQILHRDNFRKFIEAGGSEILDKLLAWISATQDTGIVIEKLQKLNVDNLKKINSLIGISNLRKILTIWNANRKNGNEDFWQHTLEEHTWVISQVFSHPVVILQKKAYVGGKAINNKGGNVVDFLFQNKLTSNVVLIEIKTPLTRLLGKQYRQNAFSVSEDLSGPINQVLTYKDELQKSFYHLSHDCEQQYQLFNPQCLIIIGCLENEAMKPDGKRSFDLFRTELKNIEIITFDELFEKIKLLLSLLENDSITSSR